VVSSTISDQAVVDTIARRSAYTRFGGTYLGKAKDLVSLANQFSKGLLEPDRTFVVDSLSLHMDECGDLGALIKERTRARVCLEKPDFLFQVEKIDDGLALAVTRNGRKQFNWKQRRPRARRFFLPSAIYPKLARALVNLSAVKEGDVFFDPFCGTGSLLIEASLMGMKVVGADITKWIARGSLLNLKHFSLDSLGIIRADSSYEHLPLRSLDGISTDVPYGRASSTRGKETRDIIEKLLGGASDSLESGKYCVVMHPSKVDLSFDRNSFQLEGQHLIYVHRSLTRAISVLRRT
jgi:tRNA (guanine10-N2)-dimethyltransferase